ncbi:MAG: radical SAM protein [Alphaproteobacteria bacterium]
MAETTTKDLFDVRLKSHHDSSGLLEKYIPRKNVTEQELQQVLSQSNNNQKTIYVHVPYCDKICSFCNLNRSKLDDELDSYADYVIKDLEKYASTAYVRESEFGAVYFGGGTPTVFKAKHLEKILKSLRKNYKLTHDYELTMETTLHNLKKPKLEVMKEYGVNRISIGIQSFSDDGRQFYNRTYNKQKVLDRIHNLKDNFGGFICTDIIYNYPNQTLESVIEDAKLIKNLGISSSSYYSLMIHQGSSIAQTSQRPGDITKEKKLYNAFLDEVLKNDEYYILELTKVAKKNSDRYRYITIRNSGGDTLPIGVGSGGNIGDIGTFTMKPGMSFYVQSSPEHLRYNRIGSQFQYTTISKAKIHPLLLASEKDIFAQKIEWFKQYHYIKEDDNNYYLTRNGVFWGNNIAKDILETLIENSYGKIEEKGEQAFY